MHLPIGLAVLAAPGQVVLVETQHLARLPLRVAVAAAAVAPLLESMVRMVAPVVAELQVEPVV